MVGILNDDLLCYFAQETGMPALKSEERKMVSVQGEKAIFTNEEIKKVKQVHQTGVTLIGFSNLRDFNHWSWYRSPGTLHYNAAPIETILNSLPGTAK